MCFPHMCLYSNVNVCKFTPAKLVYRFCCCFCSILDFVTFCCYGITRRIKEVRESNIYNTPHIEYLNKVMLNRCREYVTGIRLDMQIYNIKPLLFVFSASLYCLIPVCCVYSLFHLRIYIRKILFTLIAWLMTLRYRNFNNWFIVCIKKAYINGSNNIQNQQY